MYGVSDCDVLMGLSTLVLKMAGRKSTLWGETIMFAYVYGFLVGLVEDYEHAH